MGWAGNVGSGDLDMGSGDQITTGVVSAQGAVLGTARVSGVSSLGSTVTNSVTMPLPILASSGSVGSAAALPATPETYLTISISGQNLKIPAYRV